ncbi:unnamed protein product [Angiostrongylus costaricensis]|uniref:Reverse transcriptase domain-containing protein n=1 Tax=Angiostrongylus costaricensis TaxID=334426 RepID=A0A0R3PX77_ANGCS|nr:unnamed protein product [Angiostrongylus costaricensis]
MRVLVWNSMRVQIDGRQLHHLRFADDIVLIKLKFRQAERMLADFDKACGKIGLRLNLTKTMLVMNGLQSCAQFTLNGTNISECLSYVHLGREINMMDDLAAEMSRREQADWGAFNSINDIAKKTKNIRLLGHLLDSTVIPVLTCASETWSLRRQDERFLSVVERVVERTMLGVLQFAQLKEGFQSSDLHLRSSIKNVKLIIYRLLL